MQDTRLSLLESLRKNDPTAWELLDREYRPFVRRQVRRWLDNEADVDEITQNVFAVLARKMATFDRHRNGAFRKYLRVIASNQARKFLGRLVAGRVPRGTGTSEALAAFEQWADPISALSRQWDEEHRQYCLDLLTREARAACGERAFEIFLASRRDDLTYAQISQRFALSEAQVGRDIRRVEQAMQAIIRMRADFLDLDDLAQSLN